MTSSNNTPSYPTQKAEKIAGEVQAFIDSRRSLMLSTLTPEGEPYASYAPFTFVDGQIYVLLSEIAIHAVNLQINKVASVLIIEDEDSADELFARRRVSYSVKAELIDTETEAWKHGIKCLSARLGPRVDGLSQLSDFKLFTLSPQRGRYVKGFGRAFALESDSLSGQGITHLRDGHKRRTPQNTVSQA